jgi:tRNA-splicing ligase RtcB
MKIEQLEAIGKPYKIYAQVLEESALQQFLDVMSLDSVVKGALMPDAHTGYSLPIGGVVAVKDMVYPAFVGYDIGCGMCALPLVGVDAEHVRREAAAIHAGILKRIPTGPKHHPEDQYWGLADNYDRTSMAQTEFKKKGLRQIGTLGGGNHFIEVGSDQDGVVWAVIHSGSRNFGHHIASHYMKLASGDGKAREGAFGFHVDSQEGEDYIMDLNFALQFALANRRAMMRRIAEAMNDVLGEANVDWDLLINRNHNHAELTDGLWIHRKGATHAEEGMMGVIPGNMRDGSFIVRGKGNLDSMCSSSHGAGRVMSRKQALETVSLEEFEKTMTESGVYATVNKGTLDESPFVYKNIFEVMDLQKDLVDVVAHVKPILNVKADEAPMDWKAKKKAMKEFKGEIPCI